MNAVRWTFTPDVDAGAGLRVAVLDVEAATVLAALDATRAVGSGNSGGSRSGNFGGF